MPADLDRDTFSIDELASAITSHGSLYVAAALDMRATPIVARYLTISDHAPDGGPRVWVYGDLSFIETQSPADEVAGWLTQSRGTFAFQSEQIEFVLEDLPGTGRSERHPGRSNQDSESLPVPYRRYSLGTRVAFNSTMSDRGWLVGPGAPAFPDADAALTAFFFDTWAPGTSAPHEAVVVRLSTPGPRIEYVEFSAAEVTVRIDDSSTSSRRKLPLRLDLSIGEHRAVAEIWRPPWSATLELPAEPTSQYWWLVLSEGHRWLDRRSAEGIDQSEVHFEGGAPTPDEEVAAWTSIGECVFLEFKRELPPARDNAKMCRTVAAFANGHGGTIVFGIDRDEATVSPIEGAYDSARDRLTTIIEGNLTEVPPFEIRRLETSAGLVISLEVGTGESPPYGVDKQKPIFYIRSNATTLPATAEQVRRLARASLRDQPGRGFPYA